MTELLDDSVVVSPGLVVDTTISVLQEHGFDLSRPGLCTRTMSREEEIEIEATVTSRATAVINGQVCESYFDRFIECHTTLTGTTYDLRRGRVRRYDYSITTKTQRTKEGCLTFSDLPSILNLEESDIPLVEGKFSVIFLILTVL